MRMLALIAFLMTVHSEQFEIRTNQKGTYEITEEVAEAIGRSGIKTGTASVFVQHTSCSLIMMENADPTARRDLEKYFDRLVPEGDRLFQAHRRGTGRYAVAYPNGPDAIERGHSCGRWPNAAWDLAGYFPLRTPACRPSAKDPDHRDGRISLRFDSRFHPPTEATSR